MDSDLYIIEVEDSESTIEELLTFHDKGLSKAIVEKVCYAIDNSLSRIDIALIRTSTMLITLHSSKRNYLDTLKSNLDNLIKHEEYELCAVAKKHIDILNNNLEV